MRYPNCQKIPSKNFFVHRRKKRTPNREHPGVGRSPSCIFDFSAGKKPIKTRKVLFGNPEKLNEMVYFTYIYYEDQVNEGK